MIEGFCMAENVDQCLGRKIAQRPLRVAVPYLSRSGVTCLHSADLTRCTYLSRHSKRLKARSIPKLQLLGWLLPRLCLNFLVSVPFWHVVEVPYFEAVAVDGGTICILASVAVSWYQILAALPRSIFMSGCGGYFSLGDLRIVRLCGM